MQIWKWKSTPASVLFCIVRSTYAAVSRPTISSSSVSSLRWQRNIALYEPVWSAGPIIFSVCCLCGTELCRGGGCLRDTFPLRWQWGQWQSWWQHPNYIDNGDIVGQFWDIIQSFLVLKTVTCDYTKVDGDLCLSNRVSQNNALLWFFHPGARKVHETMSICAEQSKLLLNIAKGTTGPGVDCFNKMKNLTNNATYPQAKQPL